MATDTRTDIDTAAFLAPDFATDAQPVIGVGVCLDAAGQPICSILDIECPDCDGGEVGTRQDYWGNWDTVTCPRCDGTMEWREVAEWEGP